MTKAELKAAILSDAHREDYGLITGLTDRFVTEAEGLIASRLEAYPLEYTFGDADRGGDTTSPVYTLPARVTLIRHVIYNNLALSENDESTVALYRSLNDVSMYCVRPLKLVFAGVPPVNAALLMNYFGLPAPLAVDADTNTLMNTYPQLYKEAAMVFLYKRAENLDKSSAMFQSVVQLIDDINRRVKKQLGGAQSAATPYNVSFRSSY